MGAVDWAGMQVSGWLCWAEGAQVEWREGHPAQALAGSWPYKERSAEAPPKAGRVTLWLGELAPR